MRLLRNEARMEMRAVTTSKAWPFGAIRACTHEMNVCPVGGNGSNVLELVSCQALEYYTISIIIYLVAYLIGPTSDVVI
jgi:hypothetical protein